MISRRSFLFGAAGTVLAAGAGGALFATTRTPHAALAPWQAPGALATDPRVKAAEWAILSPNPHNRQPWLLALSGANEVTVFCDLDRRLPVTDPFDRQIMIGLGCFIELYRLAAAQEGFEAIITPFPEGAPALNERLDKRPVAHIALVDGAAPDPLFAAAPNRRSYKEPFTDQAVAGSVLAGVRTASGVAFQDTVEADRVAALRTLCWDAWLIESENPAAHQESVDLMRIGKDEIEQNPDGIDLGGPMLEALHVAGLLTRETVADPTSTAYAQGKAAYEEMIGSAKGFVWQVAENTRAAQLQAGRDWLRINLAATAAGLAVHPLSQCLQEYEAMAPAYAQAHAALAPEGGTVQMLARVGYGPDVPPTPRWPAATRIL
ncbi:MAG: twin-arginine translocation pathway signal protein [Pseudomonadota bacterium]